MGETKIALFSILLSLILLTGGGCAQMAAPGLISSTSATIRVSTSPLEWQREKGPYFAKPEEARVYAEQLDLGGFKDWRLPSREEMLDFYYAFDFGSAKASALGITIEGYYWVMDDDGTVYAGSWCDGEICEISRNYRVSSRGGFVRAVRP